MSSYDQQLLATTPPPQKRPIERLVRQQVLRASPPMLCPASS